MHMLKVVWKVVWSDMKLGVNVLNNDSGVLHSAVFNKMKLEIREPLHWLMLWEWTIAWKHWRKYCLYPIQTYITCTWYCWPNWAILVTVWTRWTGTSVTVCIESQYRSTSDSFMPWLQSLSQSTDWHWSHSPKQSTATKQVTRKTREVFREDIPPMLFQCQQTEVFVYPWNFTATVVVCSVHHIFYLCN